MQLRRIIGGVILGWSLFGLAPIWAATPMDLIPESAAVVIRLKSPEATIGKIGSFANQASPLFGAQVGAAVPALGVVISNPTLGGVDLKQDWYVAVFVAKNAQPSVVFVIPAKDEEAMKDAVGTNFTFASKENWVAYSEDNAAVELVQECLDGKSKAVATNLDKRTNSLLDGSDLAVFVGVQKLKETYAEELENADQQIDDGIEALKALTAGAAAAQAPGINFESIWEIYGQIGHAVVQGVRDSTAFSIGLKVTDEALTFEDLLIVEKDTKTDKFLQRNQPNDLSLLARLPQEQLGYFALHRDSQGFIDWGISAATSFVQDNDELKSRMEKIAQELKTLKLGAIAGTFSLGNPGDEGVLRSIALTEVSSPEKMRKLSREMTKDLKMEFPGIKQETTIQENAEKHAGHTIDVITMKQEVSEEADPLQIQKQLMDVMYGKNGMVQRVTATKEHYVQSVGGGPDQMKAALDALAQPASSATSSAVAKSRTRQLAKVNLLGMIDVPNLVVRGILIANEVMGQGGAPALPIPLPAEQLKTVKIDPSYVTFAVGTEPEGLRIRTEIPAGTLKGFFKIFEAFTKAQQGQGF